MREYIRYAFSNVLSMLGLSCYILMDTYFISNVLGSQGLAALNLVLPGFSLISAVGLMLGIGGATRYVLYRKQDTSLPSGSAFAMVAQTGMILSLITCFIGLFFATDISFLLGARGQVLEMSSVYLRITLAFTPAFVMNNIINFYVKSDGDPTLSMIAMILGSLLNIVFDYLFMYSFGWGIAGAALATGISPVVGLSVLSLHFLRHNNHFRYAPSYFRWDVLASVLSLGLPTLVSEISSGIIIVVFNTVILSLMGNIGVAAYGIIMNIYLVLAAVLSGLAEGVQPLYSRAKESRHSVRLKQLFRWTLVCMAGIVCLVSVPLYVQTGSVVDIFNSAKDPVLQEVAITGLREYFSGLVFVGVNIQVCMLLVSVDMPQPSRMIALTRGIFLILPTVLLFSRLWGIEGVWFSTPFTEGVVCSLACLYVRQHKEEIFG